MDDDGNEVVDENGEFVKSDSFVSDKMSFNSEDSSNEKDEEEKKEKSINEVKYEPLKINIQKIP